jgi:subtilisin family serine protease
MSQYVVFVDETLVAAAAAQATTRGGVDLVEAPLEARRRVLTAIANDLTSPFESAAGTAESRAVRSLASAASDTVASPVEPSPAVQVLEGVSALVVDSEQVDIEALKNVVGLSVFPDIDVALVPPMVSAAAAALPVDWHLSQIGALPSTGVGAGVLVGVLDTGIDATHAEFAGKTVHFAEFNRAGLIVNRIARDTGDHGTHVCGIVAGKTRGVAPAADLAVAAVLTGPGGSGGLIQIVNGFNWLVTTTFRPGVPGVDLVNASLGAPGFSAFLQPAVRTAWTLGIPLIAAAGNSGRSGPGKHGSPGNYPEALGVGATDSTDRVADFSDWGVVGSLPAGPAYPVPDISAPGVLVNSAKPGGGFHDKSGTSMATPVISGVAARRIQKNPALRRNPALLFLDLRASTATCTKGPHGNLGGIGRIRA